MKYVLLAFIILFSYMVSGQETKGDSLMSLGDYQNALKSYKNVDDAQLPHFKIARTQSQLGNNQAAIDAYVRGFQQDSVSVRPQFEYARLCLGNNDPITAFTFFENLSERFPENATYSYYLGETNELIGNDAGALDAFAKAISLNNNYRAARIEMIKVLIKKSRFQEAITTARPGLVQNKYDIKINSLIAQAYLGAKRYPKVIEHLELLFSIGNDTEFNRKNLALAYFNDGQWEKSIENNLRYLEDYEEKNSAVCFFISQAYLKLGKLDMAQDYIERTIEIRTPELDQEFLQLATVYSRKKDWKNTFYAMKRAKKERPQSDMLGYQYAVAGDQYYTSKTKKLEFYEEFIKEYPDSKYLEIATARATDLRKELFLNKEK
jgi:tetratricopeptide (TPR) repeat protein